MPLLPGWIMEHILDQQVLPRVTLAVEEWNPLTDTVPIHTWIHPWLPLLSKKEHQTMRFLESQNCLKTNCNLFQVNV